MPSKFMTVKLPEKYDRRVKVTQEQRKEIRELYSTGNYSWNSLSALYGVDRSRIGQIVNPRIGERVKQRNAEYNRTHIRDKEKCNESLKKHRAYKKNLMIEGKI